MNKQEYRFYTTRAPGEIPMEAMAYFPCFPWRIAAFLIASPRLTQGSSLASLEQMVNLLKYALSICRTKLLWIAAQPGYFTSTLTNGVKIEATSTRRAGLIRFTFQDAVNSTTHVVVDLTNDLQRSFQGGNLKFDPKTKKIELGGTYFQVRFLLRLDKFYFLSNIPRAMVPATIPFLAVMSSSRILLPLEHGIERALYRMKQLWRFLLKLRLRQ
jgi:hypothetical protein